MTSYDNIMLLTEYRPYKLSANGEDIVLYPALLYPLIYRVIKQCIQPAEMFLFLCTKCFMHHLLEMASHIESANWKS